MTLSVAISRAVDDTRQMDVGSSPLNVSSEVAVPARVKICLAASGGGHVRQLLDLKPVWSLHESFFVSEDTALSRSIAEGNPLFVVPHFAWGQAKLGKPWRMLGAAFRSFFISASIVLRERPDVVITTGAGAVFFVVAWARLLGAKVVVMESFARFDRPSKFARIAAPLAHRKIVQSQALATFWKDAKVFDPLKILKHDRPEKQSLLLATVGATLPFDRMVGMVEGLKARGGIPERVLIQTGVGGRAPQGLETVEVMNYADMQDALQQADVVVCHGGTGSLVTALRAGCRVIAVPRLHEMGEHYDNHQAEITRALAARGLISVANTVDELEAALAVQRGRPPVHATTDHSDLIAHLEDLIASWATSLRPRRGSTPAPQERARVSDPS